MNNKLPFIGLIVILLIASFYVTSTFLSGSMVSKNPEANDFCISWGMTACRQAGTISGNWNLDLDLTENGAPVKKSCQAVLGCDSCSSCGFL